MRILALLVFPVACLFVRAQPAPPQRPLVAFTFTVFASTPPPVLFYTPAPGQPAAPLKFHRTTRSPVYSYKGDGNMAFLDAAGATVARLRLPATARRVQLIFQPRDAASSDAPRYAVHAFDDRPETLPSGHFTLINLSGSDYAAQWGNHPPVMLAQGAGPAYKAPVPLTLRFAARQNQRWLPAGVQTITLSPKQRALVLLFPPANSGGIYSLVSMLVD